MKLEGPAFTRVLVSELKAEAVEQLGSHNGRENLLEELHHIYKYYLHGPTGLPREGARGDGAGAQVSIHVGWLEADGQVLWTDLADLEARVGE